MARNYNEVLEAQRRLGEIFTIPGVVRGTGNFDAVVRGLVVFQQRGVTDKDGASIVVQELPDPFTPLELREPRVIVEITPARPRS